MRKKEIPLGPPHHSGRLCDRRTGQAAALILEPIHLCKGFEGRHAAERERRRGRATRPCLVFNKRRRTRRDRKSASAPRRRSSTALRVTLTKKRNRARRDPPSAHSLPAQAQAVAFEASAPGPASPHRDQTLRQREERERRCPSAVPERLAKLISPCLVNDFPNRSGLSVQEGSEGGRGVRVGLRSAT